MRRRERVDPNGAPARLLRFEAREWPDGCHPECAFWAAVFAWLDAHPDGDLDVIDRPDVPFHPELL